MSGRQNIRFKILLAVSVLLVMLLEGVLAIYFRELFITPKHAIIIQLSAVFVFLIGLYMKTQWTYIITLVLYLFYDIYYSPVLSFYTLAVIVSFSIVRQFKETPASFFRDFLFVTLGLLVMNSFLYLEATVIGYHVLPFEFYFSFKIIPTVLFNVCGLFLVYYPIKKLITYIKNEGNY